MRWSLFSLQSFLYIQVSENKNYDSVPYTLYWLKVEVPYNQTVVEIYYNTTQLAFHKRSFQAGKYTSIKFI